MTSDLWAHFTLHAECHNCKLNILVDSGAFSLLFSHLKIEHDIVLKDSTKESELNSKGNEEENLDNEEKAPSENPVGIQIMKLKEEESDVEEFKDDLYFGDDDYDVDDTKPSQELTEDELPLISYPTTKDPDEDRVPCTKCKKTFTNKNTLNRHLRKIHGIYTKPKAKKTEETQDPFVKHDHFTQVGDKVEEADMICKYCGETYSNKTLSRSNWNRRLKKHLFDGHQDQLSVQLIDSIKNQIEKEKLRQSEYHFMNRDIIKERKQKKAYGLDPETGKVVRFRAKIENYNRQFHKCTYEGCTKDFISASRLRDHIRTHT